MEVIQNLSEAEHSVVTDWVVHHKDEPEGKSLHWAFVSKGINHLVVSQNCKSKTGYSSFQSVLFTTSFSRMKILVCFGP